MAETPTVKTDVGARQGKTGVGVRYVLIGGTLLIIVAFALIYAIMA